MSKKKAKKCSKKSCKKKCNQIIQDEIVREKVIGEPMPVRPVNEYYNLQTGEIYPKVFFKESWWIRFKRFLGLTS